MNVSIAIATYNTKDLVNRCIYSIIQHTKKITYEIIVVDNASLDNSVTCIKKNFPKVKVIANKKNNYLAKAINQALKNSKGKYFLILNSDVFFKDNSIKKMVEYLDRHPRVGACEGIEFYENGKLLNTGSRFSTPLIDFYELSVIGKRIKDKNLIDIYRYKNINRLTTFEVDVACDAFLMVRKHIMEKINGYDEHFLLFYTENDLCLKIKKLGYIVMHLGNAKVWHTVSASTDRLQWRKFDIYYQDLLWYYKKNGDVLSGMLLFILLKFEEVLLKIREKLLH